MKSIANTKNQDKILLRPYQNDIINSVRDTNGSVLIEVPTGGGKSVIASEIAKEEIEKGGKVLIVAPKIILIEQLEKTFQLLEPQIIHGSKDYNNDHTAFISTLQTAHKRDLKFEPTMIIIDEVHFGFSGKMIKSLLENFNGRLIGLSATPYDQNSDLIEGFDMHINKYDLTYMLENGYLVKPVCYSPVKVDLSNIKIQAGDYNQKELDDKFNNFENIMQIVKHTKDIIKMKKSALIFCINISHSIAIATAFNEAGIPTKAIHSKLSKKEQKGIIEEYKSGKIKMLANPMMLTTGFDNHATDCIVLARATKSQNLYKQMVGRGLRISEGKDHADILDCSGVIDNLGLPTSPEKSIYKSKSEYTPYCPECESTNIFITKDYRGCLVRQCADCYHNEYIKTQNHQCEQCGVIGDSYYTEDDILYMKCTQCNHKTVVSRVSTIEELKFKKIFTDSKIKDMQIKYILTYIEDLYKAQDTKDLPFREDVSRHIRAFQIYLEQNFVVFIGINSRDSVKIKYFNVYSKWKPIEKSKWSWEKNGRLFDLELENKLLGLS